MGRVLLFGAGVLVGGGALRHAGARRKDSSGPMLPVPVPFRDLPVMQAAGGGSYTD
ncbi:hypothetical protein GCM10022241_03670 [Micrococcus endophyticus]